MILNDHSLPKFSCNFDICEYIMAVCVSTPIEIYFTVIMLEWHKYNLTYKPSSVTHNYGFLFPSLSIVKPSLGNIILEPCLASNATAMFILV